MPSSPPVSDCRALRGRPRDGALHWSIPALRKCHHTSPSQPVSQSSPLSSGERATRLLRSHLSALLGQCRTTADAPHPPPPFAACMLPTGAARNPYRWRRQSNTSRGCRGARHTLLSTAKPRCGATVHMRISKLYGRHAGADHAPPLERPACDRSITRLPINGPTIIDPHIDRAPVALIGDAHTGCQKGSERWAAVNSFLFEALPRGPCVARGISRHTHEAGPAPRFVPRGTRSPMPGPGRKPRGSRLRGPGPPPSMTKRGISPHTQARLKGNRILNSQTV